MRVYLTTTISLAAVALATLCGMQAGRAAAGRPWWALGAVAASVAAAGVPAYEQIRKEQMRARAQQAAVDAAVAMRVTMNDALDPIVRQIGRVAAAADPREREALAAAAIPMAAQGDLVFSMIRHNQHLFCADIDASLPPGWQVTTPQTYQSFAAVPVAAGQNAFGMLMVDALEKGGIRRADVPLIRLLGGLIAVALA